MGDGRLAIRSYRVCFALERRIHKIDRWRIPVPFGVPLRSIGYAAAALATILLLGRLPLLGGVINAIHPALRLVVMPIAIAYGLSLWEIDGRAAHAGLAAWIRFRLAPPAVLAARRPEPETDVRFGAVTVAPDESASRLRRGVVRGPATVVIRYPFAAEPRRRTLRIAQSPGAARWQGKQLRLRSGQQLVVR